LLCEGSDFGLVIGARHVVGFDEVDAPFGVLRNDGVVVGLGAGFGHIDAVHVRVPLADVLRVGYVGGVHITPQDGHVLGNSLTRDAAQDVDPEFEALAVNVVGERCEALTIG
jgi:hypothetical protein